MSRFTLPRDLYHGKGALETLKTLKGKRAIVCVGGGSMKRGGFLDRALAYLKEAGMETKVIEGIESDPSVETVMKGAAVMQEFQPDWIVAMGGGSPIDAAKAMWIKYEYPETTFADMCKVFGLPKLRTKAHFCAISSTSGTATEVTAFSIITDYQKGIKYPIADFEITPDIAIVDPELVHTMPQKLTAHTGMDANVAVFSLFPGIEEYLVRYLIGAPELRSIVMRTFGSGNAPQKPWLIRLLKEASERGVTIVNVSQCMAGAVEMGRYDTGYQLQKAGVISGRDSTVEGAVTKLMFLQARYKDPQMIRKYMNQSLCGEITV